MAPTPVATPNLLVDPGWLFWAPGGTPEPAHAVTNSVFSDVWPAAWLPLGATVEGSTFSYETTVEAMTVAEIFDPVRYATTGRTGSLAFALAQFSLTNLARALNGATVTATGADGTSMNSLTLPTAGQEKRAMLGWESADSTVRLIVLQALNSGTLEMAFQRAPDFTSIPFEFNMELPAGATQPFKMYSAGTVRS